MDALAWNLTASQAAAERLVMAMLDGAGGVTQNGDFVQAGVLRGLPKVRLPRRPTASRAASILSGSWIANSLLFGVSQYERSNSVPGSNGFDGGSLPGLGEGGVGA